MSQENFAIFLKNSRRFLFNYIKENNLQSIVIGVSGGIDSTVSCAIASEVCKHSNIPLIGRALPSTTNKVEELQSTFKVGEAFCDDFKIYNISNDCNRIVESLEIEGKMTPLQIGNVKARFRMIYLRNLASVHRGIVIDNDNFTEWNLGFWTISGDSPMDLNLGLHYLWKTEVYELAEYLSNFYNKQGYNTQAEAIKYSINLIPTDGNGVKEGGDCAQFGLDNYTQVDDILKTLYYSECSTEEYNRLINFYGEEKVDKIIQIHQNSEFKRKPSPICPSKKDLGL